MKAGVLNQQVRLEVQTTVQDDYGQPLNEWLPVATLWAAVEPLQGREYIAASMLTSAVEARIRLRYRPGVTAAMRVIHGQDTYGIQAVIHIKSARQELQLMCKSVGV